MKTKRILIMTLVLALAVVNATSAAAGKFRNNHHDKGIFRLNCMAGLTHLDLSDLQKKQVYAIIQKYRDERHENGKKLSEAHKNLELAILSDSFNEQEFRKTLKQRSFLMEELAVMKAKTFVEIKQVLTPEQILSLKERNEKKEKRIRHHARLKQCMMETWLKPDKNE